MTQTTIVDLPLTTQLNNGLFTASSRTIPSGFVEVSITLHPTTGNIATPFQGVTHPFNSSSQSATFGMHWSWDGGTTFPASTEGTVPGSAAGTWGTDKQGNPSMSPNVVLGMPFDSRLGGSPNAYRAYADISGGPINTGLTVVETTTP